MNAAPDLPPPLTLDEIKNLPMTPEEVAAVAREGEEALAGIPQPPRELPEPAAPPGVLACRLADLCGVLNLKRDSVSTWLRRGVVALDISHGVVAITVEEVVGLVVLRALAASGARGRLLAKWWVEVGEGFAEAARSPGQHALLLLDQERAWGRVIVGPGETVGFGTGARVRIYDLTALAAGIQAGIAAARSQAERLEALKRAVILN
jgi:hypothetical protein